MILPAFWFNVPNRSGSQRDTIRDSYVDVTVVKAAFKKREKDLSLIVCFTNLSNGLSTWFPIKIKNKTVSGFIL